MRQLRGVSEVRLMTKANTKQDYSISPIFSDARNINYGEARVIWAPARGYQPEGWILPGGARTQNFAEAHGVAVAMDQVMREARA